MFLCHDIHMKEKKIKAWIYKSSNYLFIIQIISFIWLFRSMIYLFIYSISIIMDLKMMVERAT